MPSHGRSNHHKSSNSHRPKSGRSSRSDNISEDPDMAAADSSKPPDYYEVLGVWLGIGTEMGKMHGIKQKIMRSLGMCRI